MTHTRRRVIAITFLSGVIVVVAVTLAAQSSEFKFQVIALKNGLRVQTDTPGGALASLGGYGDVQVDAPGIAGGRFALKENGRLGLGTPAPLAVRYPE